MEQATERNIPGCGVVRTVAVTGGTHGNERGGIWTIRNMEKNPSLFEFPGLDVRGFLAHPAAAKRNLRYRDRDLNRCFGPQLGNNWTDSPETERRRALELRDEICPNGIAPDLLVDLHNTTSAMGVTWILTALDPLLLWLAANASARDPRTKILHTPETAESNVFLPSLGRREITLEIGPVSHGTESHWAWKAAQDHLLGILGDLSRFAAGGIDCSEELAGRDLEFFQTFSVEPYPTDASGRGFALVHELAAGGDYREFRDGDPLFFDPFSGTTIPHRGDPMYPVFLGEAAYVESTIAYHATRRFRWNGTRGVPCQTES
jgi:succinylglutamate desuccinylase